MGVLGCAAGVLGRFFEEKMVCFPRCHFWGGKSLKTPMVLNRFFSYFFFFSFVQESSTFPLIGGGGRFLLRLLFSCVSGFEMFLFFFFNNVYLSCFSQRISFFYLNVFFCIF